MRIARLLVPICMTLGCGSDMVQVTGMVSLDGEPLEGATVTFFRADGKGRPAAGITDPQGSFNMTSYQANDGLPPGDYKVTITKVVNGTDFKTSSASLEKKHRTAYAKAKPVSPEVPDMKKVLPLLYENPRETPFTCRVPPDEELRFELESSPAP